MKRANPDRQAHEDRAVRLSALAEQLSARATSVTVPLYRLVRNENPVAFASGVLLAIEGMKFLLSAGHIFNDSACGEIFAAGFRRSIMMVQGTPRRLRTPGSRESGKDQFDIAIFELSGGTWEAVPTEEFLSIDEVASNIPRAPTGSFAVIGYPFSKQPTVRGMNVVANAYRLAAKASPKAAYEALGYNDDVNLLLGFEKRKIWNGGRLQTAPDPIGMSGGGTWTFDGPLAAASKPPLLAGIAIEWREKTQNKVIVSTRIDQILQAIGDKHEILQRTIGMKLLGIS